VIIFKSAREWLDAMIVHQCGREKKMIPSDNPLRGQLGFVCVGCDAYFLLDLDLTNRKAPFGELSVGELSSEERKMLSTVEGRSAMDLYLRGTVVQVREEVEL
jgi:hypothetical protein